MITNITPENYMLDSLDPDVIAEIESELGCKIPEPLCSLLVRIGFLQNVIAGDWPGSRREFLSMQEYMPDGCVAFMGDGAGNYYVMCSDGKLVFWDHETNQTDGMDQDFEDFITGLVRDPEPPDKLAWRTQLAFDSNNDAVVLGLLGQYLGVKVAGDWAFKDTSPDDVYTYTLPVTTEEGPSIVSKQRYEGWSNDIYYFNKVIPTSQIEQYKRIFDALENDTSVKFTLIDYGILPTDLEEDI